MGREHTGPRKQICVSLIVLMLVSVTGCALWGGREGHKERVPSGVLEDEAGKVPPGAEEQAAAEAQRQAKSDAAHTHLVTARKLFLDGDYAGALREYESVLSASADGPAAEEALLSMGLIWAHPANPRRNYRTSALYLKRLTRLHVKSIFVEQARVLAHILRENSKAADRIKKLRAVLEGLEKVDIEIEGIKKVQER